MLLGDKVKIPGEKIKRYELMYVKFSWGFILIGLLYVILSDMINNQYQKTCSGIFFDVSFFVGTGMLNALKIFLIKKGLFQRNFIYLGSRFIELFIVVYSIAYLGVGEWGYIAIIFPILVTSFCKGDKLGLVLIGYSFAAHLAMVLSRNLFFNTDGITGYNIAEGVLILIAIYSILVLFAMLCRMIYKDNIENEQENTVLLKELKEKYEQLAAVQEEIQIHYDMVKDTNTRLEDTNKKLSSSIAEFYTVQQISQAIGSIFDIKELLKYVNDIIIGVMGVSNSTIMLYDEKRKKLKIHTTNIASKKELAVLNDNVNCSVLLDALESNASILDNVVDPLKYIFTWDREVNSIMCVPLSTKSRKFGIALLEHKYHNAFDAGNARLLDIIGQQVGIALENAELYQKMQELATIDGLTGVYNRLYFHERLQKEFKDAQEKDYELSLAIFDIDHFKKFNDTYGHLFGDKVLKSIAGFARNSLRNGDIIARFGGEEFIIVFPRTSIKEAYEKVDAIRQKIATTEIKDININTHVTVSFGISCYPECATEHDLLRDADTALYEAKDSGRNCVKLAKAR